MSQGTLSATFNLRAENCRLVVWADIVPEETHVSPYYMTGTLNPVSPADPDSYPGNTALKEVFCASIDLQLSGHADGGTEPLDVKLENPAAGYVLVAGDLSRFLSDGQAFGDAAYTCRVRYLGSLRLGYSPLKGIATYALDNISYSQVLNLPASGEEMTVASDSFFLPETGETIIAVELLDSNGETVSYSQVSLRDIEAGSVRTIKGNFLTSYPEDNADISIDGDFNRVNVDEVEKLMRKLDPGSFMIMLQANEVQGEGFRRLVMAIRLTPVICISEWFRGPEHPF